MQSQTKKLPKAYSKDELFAEWGVSIRAGEKMLTKAIADGLMTAEWVEITDRTGRKNRRPVYSPVQSRKSSGTRT